MAMKKTVCIVVALIVMMTAITAQAEALTSLFGGLTSLFSLEPEKTYEPGETAELGECEITLTDVMISNGNSYYKPAEGNEFVLFEFVVKNTGKSDLVLSSILCFSVSVDNTYYQLSLEADALGLVNGKMQLDTVAESNQTVSGIVGYEIPKGWKEALITFKPDVYAFDNAVFKVEQ